MSDIAVQVTRGALGAAARVDEAVATDPPGSTPPIPDASPVLYTAPLPYTIIARFETASAVAEEGTSVRVRCILNRVPPQPALVPLSVNVASTADPANYTITSTAGGTGEVTAFEFGAGQTSAEVWVNMGSNFAEGTTRFLRLDIDDDTTQYVDTGTGASYRVSVITGDFSEFYLQGTNGGVATPVYGWGVTDPEISIPENLDPPIALLPVSLTPALGAGDDDVVVAIDATQVTAGPGWSLLTQSVTFTPGATQQLVSFEVENDSVDSPFDAEVDLALTLVSGTANPGAETTLRVIVVDDEPNASSERYVQWQTGTQFTVNEGETTTQLVARIVDGNGDQATLSTLADVPVTLGGTAADGDYSVNWGSSPAGFLRFDAGVPEAAVTVTAADDGDPESSDRTVTLALGDDPSSNNAWQANNALDTLTITILGQPVEEPPTELLHPSSPSTQPRIIQGLVAVSPPSATLPTYQLSTGETVQAVGMRRNGDDEWTAAYFYGFSDERESRPGQSGATSIAYQTTGTAPSQAGTFVDSQTLTFSLDLANVASPMTTTTAVPFDVQWLAGVNESVEWAQTGPDLVRTRVLRNQFHVSTPTASYLPSGDGAGEGAGLLELSETRIAGEDDVILYEGRFGPCGWAGAVIGAPVDGYTPNPFCDGEMYVDSLSVSCPAGWTVELIDAHPDTANDGTGTVDLLTARTDGSGNDQPYHFGAGDSTTFWFALVRTAAYAGGIARARNYVRKRNIAWTVGPLGATQNPIYNDAGDYSPNWQAAGLSSGNNTGWDAIAAAGEARETNAISAWTGGTALVGWGGGGRRGRTIEDTLAASGATGGEGVVGCFGQVPWGGYWYERMMVNHRIAGRIAHFVDVGQGANFPNAGPVFAWKNLQNVSGETRTRQTGHANEIQGALLLYQFGDHRIKQAPTFSDYYGTNAWGGSDFATAPIDRPWNYPVEIASTLTVSTITDTNGNVGVAGGPNIGAVTVSGTVPAATPSAGVLTITRPDGYLHKVAYSSRSGQTFNVTSPWSNAGYADTRALSDWSGLTVKVYEGSPDEWVTAGFSQHDFAHSSRWRNGFIDQWWGMRSFLGLSVYEDVASSTTRAYNPWRPLRDAGGFQVQISNLWAFRETRANYDIEDWKGTGAFPMAYGATGDPSSVSVGWRQQTRGVGWSLAHAAGYFQAAGDRERAEFRGQGGVASWATPRSWLDDYAEWIDFVTSEVGVVGRTRTGAPNAWGSTPGSFPSYPPADWSTRTGLVPNPDYTTAPPAPAGRRPWLSGVYSFQNLYAMNGVYAFLQALPTSHQYRAELERCLLLARRHLEACQNFLGAGVIPTSAQFSTYVHLQGGTTGTTNEDALAFADGSFPSIPPTKYTLADFQSLPDVIWFVRPGATRFKWAWNISQYGLRTGESSAPEFAKIAFGRPVAEPDQDFISFLMEQERVAQELTGFGEMDAQPAFCLPLIGYLQNN